MTVIESDDPRTQRQKAGHWSDRWLDTWYRRQPGWVNGTVEFHALCARSVSSGNDILEVGPGPSNDTSKFLASLGPTHGLDPDPKARENRFLTSFHELTGASYPFPDEMFSVAVSTTWSSMSTTRWNIFGKCIECFGPEASTCYAHRTCTTTWGRCRR